MSLPPPTPTSPITAHVLTYGGNLQNLDPLLYLVVEVEREGKVAVGGVGNGRCVDR